jgi:ABC-type antimicrobial peptide transport system permease subunit
VTLLASARVAVRAMRATPLRSLLTALGVIIGVASVVTMVAIGQGARQATTEQVQALGSNLLTVFAGTPSVGGVARAEPAQSLSLEDAEAIRTGVPGVTGVSAELQRQAQVVYRGENTFTRILGVTPEYETVRNFRAVRGSYFTDDEMRARARVALVGQTVAARLFGEVDPVGAQVKIRGVTFTVIGVLEAKGATAFFDRDDVVLVPITTAQRRLFGTRSVGAIQVQVASEAQMPAAAEALAALMRTRHRLAPGQADDFTIRSQADILQTLTGVAQTMTVLLGGIAAVSLVVGGIGIMNIMLVSVTERTREIGIRKAVGARRRDILMQFLVEAIALSAGGGVLGIGLGVLATRLIAQFAGWATLLAPSAIVLAFSFALAVGLFFGLYPAQRAARLDPIEALRHE